MAGEPGTVPPPTAASPDGIGGHLRADVQWATSHGCCIQRGGQAMDGWDVERSVTLLARARVAHRCSRWTRAGSQHSLAARGGGAVHLHGGDRRVLGGTFLFEAGHVRRSPGADGRLAKSTLARSDRGLSPHRDLLPPAALHRGFPAARRSCLVRRIEMLQEMAQQEKNQAGVANGRWCWARSRRGWPSWMRRSPVQTLIRDHGHDDLKGRACARSRGSGSGRRLASSPR